MLSKWCSSHIKSRKNGKKFANNKKKLGPKGAGMTVVSRGTEYPLLHEILHTVSVM